MKNFIAIVMASLLIILTVNVTAQSSKADKPSYKTAIGIRFYPTAVTLKTMTSKKTALELIGYFKDGFRLTGLYQFHGIINEGQNLKWYVGGGGHLGLGSKDSGNDFKAGVDGCIGLDYKFLHLPLNLSLDYQPAFGFGDDNNFTNWGGIAVRFTL